MTQDEKAKILILLIGKEHLISESLFNRKYSEVEQILNMKEWDDPKFQPLLTSTIWQSNYTSIQKILSLPYWSNPKYAHLLRPTIFAISIKNIQIAIEIFEKYGIEDFITLNAIRKKSTDLELLINYLMKEKIPLVIQNKLNPILFATKKNLKLNYGIDITTLKGEQIYAL